MIVKDLRDLLIKYDASALREMFVEVYKKIPKKVKEESSIDNILENFGEAPKKSVPVEKNKIDFPKLRDSVNEFLINAKAENYLAPNRIIPKERRSVT
jgi:hypothetical protein